ncbi:complement C1q tumor necrosis factor-related protein 7-like [Argopecten irradians]|uniref:complement C1q tumor necrosis factor-related protein 7-like n=1 Tax=Argopecten irradians TaxID=31199 RepID=UPI0037101193
MDWKNGDWDTSSDHGTRLNVRQQKVVSLSNTVDDVIREFVTLKQKHEYLERKFQDVSTELNQLRDTKDLIGNPNDKNIQKQSERMSFLSKRSGNTAYTPTFALHNNLKGQSSSSGRLGLKGEKGDPGPVGTTGAVGPTGPKGDLGATGLKGEKGNPGLVGPNGRIGVTGPKGEKGKAGSTGIKGNVGHKGEQGAVGSKGDPGPTAQKGAIGPKGDKGDSGLPDIHRCHGHQGSVGITEGYPGSCVKHRIAFYAELGNDLTQLFANQQLAVSDVLNVGGGYDKHTGKFTAPVDGIYVFSVTVVVGKGGSVVVFLHKGRHVIMDVYAGSVTDRDSGSNTIAVHLRTGDRVWIQIHRHSYNSGTVIDNRFTTFTGFLLYEL